MGGSSFDYNDWQTTSTKTRSKSINQIYTTSSLHDDVDPAKMKNGQRESCDSDANPKSTPIIIGLDATGSMQTIPEYMIKTGLGEMFKSIYERKPVSDPQVAFCCIGDVVAGDRAPFQVGQFESQCDLLVDGLTKFWLNGCGGGGNDQESYDLPYYFAVNHTKTDSFQKRGQKGYLITIGDEPPPRVLTAGDINKVFGTNPEGNVTFEQLVSQVRRTYIPIHIIIEEGSHVRAYGLDTVLTPWRNLLGEDAIVCSDYTKLAEIITSILQVKAGMSAKDVIDSWDGSTSVAVSKAVSSLTTQQDSSVVF